ncbi:MAG: TetR/AcrR family transcriptional regulator [Lachnospiraceae bacterium]|nr:TetR/AcrR family transcriptional regulator [Lachnospiraceae bacterium]
MGKAETNKQIKRESLLNTAFDLFTTKGINNTSIADIVEAAGVAKGTFYLYFKDKYDINSKLLVHRSSLLFASALTRMHEMGITDVREKIFFVIDDIIDALTKDKVLLMFISKNLGLGFSRYMMESPAVTEEEPFASATKEFIEDIGNTISDPRLMMYMIIELTGSSIYSAILYDKPVTIDELKPHLYKTISSIIDQFTER